MIKPRILFTCGREPEYVRNLLLLRALRKWSVVVEVTDHRPGSLLLRNIRLLPRLARALMEPHDLVFVGFYGYVLTVLLRPLTRKPMLLDAFVSNWDTLCFDRKRFAPYSLPGKLTYSLDRQACLAADHCLLDTETHRRYFVDTFDLPEPRLSTLYLGYDEELFYPRPEPAESGACRVFSYGSFLPLHGMEVIVQAAKLLENEQDVEFVILGEGMTHARVQQFAQDLCVRRLTFLPVVPYAQLPQAIAPASICLGGPFGATEKASRVIAGKTFQFLAMAKATIVGDTPANRELFVHGDDVLMCGLADAQALAEAILELKRDAALRTRLAQRGYEHCRDQFSLGKQAERLESIISGLL